MFRVQTTVSGHFIKNFYDFIIIIIINFKCEYFLAATQCIFNFYKQLLAFTTGLQFVYFVKQSFVDMKNINKMHEKSQRLVSL